MTSAEIRKKYLDFFADRGHTIVMSSPLVPKDDSSVLFTTAGMQQFKPYYTGDRDPEKMFASKNTVSVQKCVRTGDIEEVGDDTHFTFFEMLGNFSFGGYGRKEAIEYAYEFITKELGLSISYVTFYKGAGSVPRDDASKEVWESLGVQDIREDGSDVFWGPTGTSGPCGPTTEIYCKNAVGVDVEIWNIVFNEYFCNGSRAELDKGNVTLEKLPTLGIDTGMGFERLLATIQKKTTAFDTDLLAPTIAFLTVNTGSENDREARIIVDHIRTSMFMIADAVLPANKDQGYILRRLIRRATKYLMNRVLLVEKSFLEGLIAELMNVYGSFYPELLENKEKIIDTIYGEIQKFGKTLQQGLKEFEKGADPFILATSYGFPVELTEELAKEKGVIVDRAMFDQKMKAHQNLSRSGAEQKFKGGLANTSEITTKLHTAHHLLLAALQETLSKDIHQKGSNITEERLRIDFNFDRKVTADELEKIEKLVNEKIQANLLVMKREMSREDAEKLGAEMEFGTKYPETVSVYMIHDESDNIFSKEFCGGPHVAHTGELGTFKILKEEASAQGIRRIKATLT